MQDILQIDGKLSRAGQRDSNGAGADVGPQCSAEARGDDLVLWQQVRKFLP